MFGYTFVVKERMLTETNDNRENSLSLLAKTSIKQPKSEIFCILNLQAVRRIVLDPKVGFFYDASTVIFSKNKNTKSRSKLDWEDE
jgi:hypothetical protein